MTRKGEERASLNFRRAARGRAAIALHPDRKLLDLETLAIDTIADVLHAVYRNADGGLVPIDRDGAHVDGYTIEAPQQLLKRALRTFYGDTEDDAT